MKMVCVARLVPDPRAAIKVRTDGSGIDTAGLKYVCDPFDEFGIELAVQLRERHKTFGAITVLGAGGASTSEALRHALAMGCDRAAQLLDDAIAPWDEIRLAHLLAALVRMAEPGPDLVLCGKQSTDNDAGELG